MKQPVLHYLFAGLIVLLLSACEKEAAVIPVVSSTPINGSGAGSGAGTGGNTPGTTETYQPVSNGSYWKYVSTGSITDEQTQTITGRTASFNSKNYYEMSQVSKTIDPSLGYFNTDNGLYKLRASTYISGVTIELTYLDANKAVGETWTAPITDNGQVNGVPARVLGKIIEKGISRTVLGKSYSNVVHTQVDIQYNMGGFDSYSSYDMYIAKGVGIIETNNTIFGQKFSDVKLVEYSIK